MWILVGATLVVALLVVALLVVALLVVALLVVALLVVALLLVVAQTPRGRPTLPHQHRLFLHHGLCQPQEAIQKTTNFGFKRGI